MEFLVINSLNGLAFGSVLFLLAAGFTLILGIPEDYELATMVLIGLPAEVPRKREFGAVRPDFSWLHKNRFGIGATL